MFFTQEDYNKIQKWLLANSIKDTEFAEAALPLKGNETLAFVQNGQNVKVFLKDLIDQMLLLGVSDFLNITDKYNESYISLTQAIQLIPFKSRKTGQVITFINQEGNWGIYQFQGTAVNQWNNITLWVDLIEQLQGVTIIDSEDIVSEVNTANQTSLYLANKTYDTQDYSGLGRVYLRKNIQTVTNPNTGVSYITNLLTQSMLSKENTIYIIQYDYSLNFQTVVIPNGSVLLFEGGSLDKGSLSEGSLSIPSASSIVGTKMLHKGLTITNYNGIINIGWFIDYDADLVSYYTSLGLDIYFPQGTYTFDKEIIILGSTKSSTIFGEDRGNTSLVFPNGDGLLFADNDYYKYASIHDLSITSKGYCINFAPADVSRRMIHLWKYDFYRLTLSSAEGACIYADNNIGKNSTPAMLYEVYFKDIKLDFATYGIDGVYGLAIAFDNVTDEYRQVADPIAIFRNCDGVFRNINSTMTFPHHFLLIDLNHSANYHTALKFDSVNMETLTDSAIKVIPNNIAVTLYFWNTFIQYYPIADRNFLQGPDKTIPFYPIDATLINSVEGDLIIRAYGGASFQENKQYIAGNLVDKKEFYTDRERTIFYKSLNKPVLFEAGYGIFSNPVVANNQIPVTWSPAITELQPVRLDINTVRNLVKTAACSDLFNKDVFSEPNAAINLTTDADYQIRYYYTSGGASLTYDGTTITFKNTSNFNITILHNWGDAEGNFRFFNIEGKTLTLGAGESVTYMMINSKYYQVNTGLFYRRPNDWLNLDGTLRSKVVIV